VTRSYIEIEAQARIQMDDVGVGVKMTSYSIQNKRALWREGASRRGRKAQASLLSWYAHLADSETCHIPLSIAVALEPVVEVVNLVAALKSSSVRRA
jgi:hypothetical protein